VRSGPFSRCAATLRIGRGGACVARDLGRVTKGDAGVAPYMWLRRAVRNVAELREKVRMRVVSASV
jgi:hypothetical protein